MRQSALEALCAETLASDAEANRLWTKPLPTCALCTKTQAERSSAVYCTCQCSNDPSSLWLCNRSRSHIRSCSSSSSCSSKNSRNSRSSSGADYHLLLPDRLGPRWLRAEVQRYQARALPRAYHMLCFSGTASGSCWARLKQETNGDSRMRPLVRGGE